MQSLDGKAKEIAARLLQLAKMPRTNELQRLLPAIAQIARQHFQLESENLDPLLLSIMAFDEKTSKLHIASANFGLDDLRWESTVEYGDGIPGRAYKMNRASLFVRARAIANDTPLYQVPTPDVTPEEAILSLPLTHPQQAAALFGILNISSLRPSSGLVNLTEDAVTTTFQEAVSGACFAAIDALYPAS